MDERLLEERITTERLRQQAIYSTSRPSFLYRDYLYFDGKADTWVCVGGMAEEKIAEEYDDEVTCRVYGYGTSPEEALEDFDRAWISGEFEVKI